jgi:twinkle protein
METEFVQSKPTFGLIPTGQAGSLAKRKLTEETCKKYGYTVGEYKGQPCQIANYKKDGTVVAQKIRFADKSFKFLGDAKSAGLYGQHLFKGGGAMLCLTEGELDTLSLSQAQGNRFPVCSLPSGAGNAVKAVQNSLDFVESFDRVVLMFDNDEHGRKASLDVAKLLSPSKAHIATLPLKDASDMLVAGKTKQMLEAMWEAKPYRPDGIIAGVDMWELVSTPDTTKSIPYPFDGLNEKTRGLRRGELTTITAGSGVGKSQVCREIAYHLIKQHNEAVGYIALEENCKHTAISLMGLELNLPLHLTQEGISNDNLKSAFDATVGSGNFYSYDHFGSMSTEGLMQKVRYLTKSCGVSFIVIDHLSVIVSGDEHSDERKSIDIIMTKLRSLVEETGIGLILVSHLRRPAGEQGWENGKEVTLNSLRGSAGIAQLSDMVISVERDQQGDNPNTTTVRILKNRYSGETGVGCYLNYNIRTGRMIETQCPDNAPDFGDDEDDY